VLLHNPKGRQKQTPEVPKLEPKLIQTRMTQKPLLWRSGQKCLCACGDLRIAPLSACSKSTTVTRPLNIFLRQLLLLASLFVAAMRVREEEEEKKEEEEVTVVPGRTNPPPPFDDPPLEELSRWCCC
jgi:hypothetical protein